MKLLTHPAKLCCWVVLGLIGASTAADTSKPAPLAFLRLAPDWSFEEVLPEVKLNLPIALAFDRHGGLWLVDRSDHGTRLIHCRGVQGNVLPQDAQVVPTKLKQIAAICAWGDWLYLAAQGQLIRYRLKETGLEGPEEVVLRGLPESGPIHLTATPQGIWLGTVGGRLTRGGEPPTVLPALASSWVLVPYDGSKARLMHWENGSWCGPAVPDADGFLHWLAALHDGGLRGQVWDMHLQCRVSDLPLLAQGADDGEATERVAWEKFSDLVQTRWSEGVTAGIRTPYVGPIFEYLRREGEQTLDRVYLWAKVWPGQLFEFPSGSRIEAKPKVRLSIQGLAQAWFTALASAPHGGIYIAGRWRSGRGPARGFVARLLPQRSDKVVRYHDWHRVALLDTADLLERLATNNPWEIRAVQEEICRRGPNLAPALVEFAQRQHVQALHSTAALRAVALLAALDARAGRNLALEWSQQGEIPQFSASAMLLSRLPNAETRLVLTRRLSDGQAQLRRIAALALGALGGSEAASSLVQFLRVLDERDDEGLHVLVRSIELCEADGLTALSELLDTGSATELNIATKAWTLLRQPEALDYVRKFLHHPHLRLEQRQALLRWWANLAKHYQADSSPILQWLEAQSNVPAELLAEALHALAQAPPKSDRLGPLAERYLTHSSLTVRLAALSCVRASQHTASSPVLLRMVSENARSTQERLWAAETLLSWRNRDILTVLVGHLGDHTASQTFREQLAALLMTYGDKSTYTAVLEHLRSWPQEMVRETLVWLRSRKEPLLFLAEACLQNKLDAKTWRQPLQEVLALWAITDPRAEHYFDLLGE